MRSILIIGLGRFGRHLSMRLSELGNELLVIDQDERCVNEIAPFVTAAQIGDCTDESVIKSLGASEFDLSFVCISNNLETSLIITMMLKEQGAKKVIAKVNQDLHAKFLLSNGADAVIYPERDMALRTAMKYSAASAFDYLELSSDYGIFEIAPPKSWIGHSLKELDIRKKYRLNVIAYKENDVIKAVDSQDFIFRETMHLLIAGERQSFQQCVKKHASLF